MKGARKISCRKEQSLESRKSNDYCLWAFSENINKMESHVAHY